MLSKTQSLPQKPLESVNALARQAIEKIKEIDRKATAEKEQQVEALRNARVAIHQRITELQGQEKEIDNAIVQITGKSEAAKPSRKKRTDLSEVRVRLVRWLQSHKDQRYTSRQLQTEFPELAGTGFAMFIRSAIEEGQITKEGTRVNMTYAAA